MDTSKMNTSDEVREVMDSVWLAEVERRDAEMEADPFVGPDFDAVIQSIRQKRPVT
jgi:hypothetical protein